MQERNLNTIKLYNRILEQEQRLDNLRFDLASSIRAGDHNRLLWYECRHMLRVLYEEVTRTDPHYVSHGSLLAQVWGRLYHGPVEQARMNIAKGGFDWEPLRIEMVGILDEGIGFFLLLVHFLNVNNIKSKQHACPSTYTTAPQFPIQLEQSVMASVSPCTLQTLLYECQLYLGDLHRYKYFYFAPTMQLTDLYHMDLLLSKGHYTLATETLPGNGHAWNQLAVLSSLQEHLAKGCLYYARATMAIKPFGKSADNLLTICRKLVNIHEEHLDLAASAIVAALLGMLLRLGAAAIVHELARNSQITHMEIIVRALEVMFQKRYKDLWLALCQCDDQDVELLHSLTSLIILLIEFLQKTSSNVEIKERYFGRGQAILSEWVFKLADRLLMLELDSMKDCSHRIAIIPAYMVSVWLLLSEDALSRSLSPSSIIEDENLPSNPGIALKDLLRTICQHVNTRSTVMPINYQILLATRFTTLQVPEGVFDNPFHSLVEHLCHKHLILVRDESTGTYCLREDLYRAAEREKKFTLFLQRQSVGSISTILGENEQGHNASWHLCDSACLLEYWNRIEGLLQVRALRLIVTLANLRYLDYIKGIDNKGTRARTARNIMRSIMAFDRAKLGQVHLQGPRETLNIPIPWKYPLDQVAKHHSALLSAYGYFSQIDTDFIPLVLLVKEEPMRKLLDTLQFDYIPEIGAYLNKL